ncbi:MAG: 2-C-methyl-D-erythritol 4-phosphate cytidylyltransferase [Bacteroidota bacterium]|nr:2-C-methyl-D-erythritol 4-phosphate cytidylyltransferase [Bacteroidota bacterium]
MKKYAVIVAGGYGLRMGGSLPKQFLLIHNRPVLWYTLNTFLKSFEDIRILLVLPAEYLEMGRSIGNDTGSAHRIEIIPGGETRFHSVQKGLAHVRERSIVFVHDGVRCLLSPALIHRCFEEAQQFGSAVPCIDSKDSVRILTDAGFESIKRTRIKLMQTPQTFLSDLILPAYQAEYREEFTDDASVVEAFHRPIHLVEGEVNNIKITTPLDIILAEKLLEQPHYPF